MSGRSSGDLRVKNSQCNYVTFPSLPLKDGETFTLDDWFVAEAATEGGGLPRKQTLHFKPTLLTASRPPVQCNAQAEALGTVGINTAINMELTRLADCL